MEGSALIAVQDAAVQPDGPSRKEMASRTATLTLAVFLIGFFGVVLLVTLMMIRRRRRTEAAASREQAEASAKAPPTPDAWEEAGRRIAVPPAEDLTDTRVGMEALGTSPEARPHPSGRPGRPMVLVTGAARRVGRAIVLEFARAGCDVSFTYHASGDEAESLAREAAALGAEGTFFQVDLSDAGAVEAFAQDRAEMQSRLDVIVHNAALYEPSPLDEVTLADAERQMRVNAIAPLILTAKLAPLLRQSGLRGGASVIALADIHAMGRPRRNFGAYAMSKAALVEMVRCLARDLAPEVRVNAVAPGVVAWPESGIDAGPEEQARYLRRIPLRRAGTPEDAAKVVRWLALEATYVTGEVIRVDGGRWLT